MAHDITVKPITQGEVQASSDELLIIAGRLRELAPKFALERTRPARREAVVQLAAICGGFAVDLARLASRLRDEVKESR